MEDRKLDSLIEETLEQQADRISMSSDLQRKIKQEIRAAQMKEESTMRKHLSVKKVVLAAAVMCVLMSMVAVAGGKVAGWVSGSNPNNPDIVSFAEIGKADSHMGVKVYAVEKFTNGLSFDRGFNQTVNEVDDAGVVVGTFPETMLRYVDGKRFASLSVIPAGRDDQTALHAEKKVITYKGFDLTVVKDYYRFVPTDYVVSPEEEAAMKAGQLYISYGSSEVENVVYYAVTWSNGLDYNLMASNDNGVGEEELVQMAKEIIDVQ